MDICDPSSSSDSSPEFSSSEHVADYSSPSSEIGADAPPDRPLAGRRFRVPDRGTPELQRLAGTLPTLESLPVVFIRYLRMPRWLLVSGAAGAWPVEGSGCPTKAERAATDVSPTCDASYAAVSDDAGGNVPGSRGFAASDVRDPDGCPADASYATGTAGYIMRGRAGASRYGTGVCYRGCYPVGVPTPPTPPLRTEMLLPFVGTFPPCVLPSASASFCVLRRTSAAAGLLITWVGSVPRGTATWLPTTWGAPVVGSSTGG